MKDLSRLSFDIGTLQSGYHSGAFTPGDVVAEVYRRIRASENNPIWICLIREEDAIAAADALADPPNKSVFGIPFAVKDNIDVADLPTTAACPSFSYVAHANATVVQRLLDDGAILIGKTNLDQFATGLVGVRSPFGTCRNLFNSEYISGGSSSGSALAVAGGLVSFCPRHGHGWFRTSSLDLGAGRTTLRASVLLAEASFSILRGTWGFLKRIAC
jgi:allophanate hydrolase